MGEHIAITSFENIEALREFIRKEVRAEVKKIMAERTRRKPYMPSAAEYKSNSNITNEEWAARHSDTSKW